MSRPLLPRRALLAAPLLLLGRAADAAAPALFPVAAAGVQCGCFLAQGEQVLAGTLQGEATLWQWRDERQLARFAHEAPEPSGAAAVRACAAAPDGAWLATAAGSRLHLWQPARQRHVGPWELGSPIRAVALTGDAEHLLIGTQGMVAWHLPPPRQGRPAPIRQNAAIGCVALTADGRLGVTGSDDGVVRVWDLADGTARHRWALGAPIRALALSPDERVLAAAPGIGPVRLWHLEDGRPAGPAIGPARAGFAVLAFTADGRRLVTGSASGEVALWSLKSGERKAAWNAPRRADKQRASRPNAVLAVTALGKGSYAALLSSGQVAAWGV
ncbi:WD domain, G-beta repeat [Tepidimonas sediminis]|uniref:WD domain, G-beta repeat n=1 Tax=Tepidimonas sediminis TaxID=2588941 RepID=A0A554WS46_9BURK|nr:WD40 repeat domain-containing protein [Tepidimonas sediminis]TSE26373.1 WD domain, G-beta repeat [Tepidimonas sediminis]